ncbi:conserved membrane protein of unknown function [Ectopseudomonas oleovorans]|uniref:Uncharacterized protein n=2 Tax=Ectopseudomonas TaxID=3236654 RepID=A0A653AXL6_ECTOL|nr:conserved membrane protein of unknown function [Pseudomonas oleovorans]
MMLQGFSLKVHNSSKEIGVLDMRVGAVLGSKLAMITGWGTGLAFLFILFGSKVNLAQDVLRVMDALLALSVSIFTFLCFSAVSAEASDLEKTSGKVALYVSSGKVQGVLFSVALLLCGWLTLDAAPEIAGAVRTATAFGTSMTGVGVVVLYIGVAPFMKGKRT